VCRDGAGGFAIQSVGSNDDYLLLRDRTGSDGYHRLVVAELEADSEGIIPSIITMHILLLVRCPTTLLTENSEVFITDIFRIKRLYISE
jgi:hypothetical protein